MRVPRRAVVTVAALAACSGRYSGSRSRRDGARASLLVRGSDTMVLLARRWAEAFAASNRCDVEVAGGGSGTGIAALLNGTADLAMSSRRMHERERRALEAQSRASSEHVVATDAVAVYAASGLTIAALSLAQLAAIYRGRATRWTPIDGRDERVIPYGRESSSGTYAFFKERVLDSLDFAAEVQSLPGTASVVEAVARDPRSLGYAGLASHIGVQRVPLSADGPAALAPTKANILSGAYPLSRPLYLYLAARPSAQASAFVRWVLTTEGQAIVEREGFCPLAERT